MATDEVTESLRRLRHRIDSVLEDHGLRVLRFAISPPPQPGAPLEFQVLAALLPDSEEAATDEFDEVIAGAAAAEVEVRARQARDELVEELRRRMDGGEDIL